MKKKENCIVYYVTVQMKVLKLKKSNEDQIN